MWFQSDEDPLLTVARRLLEIDTLPDVIKTQEAAVQCSAKFRDTGKPSRADARELRRLTQRQDDLKADINQLTTRLAVQVLLHGGSKIDAMERRLLGASYDDAQRVLAYGDGNRDTPNPLSESRSVDVALLLEEPSLAGSFEVNTDWDKETRAAARGFRDKYRLRLAKAVVRRDAIELAVMTRAEDLAANEPKSEYAGKGVRPRSVQLTTPSRRGYPHEDELSTIALLENRSVKPRVRWLTANRGRPRSIEIEGQFDDLRAAWDTGKKAEDVLSHVLKAEVKHATATIVVPADIARDQADVAATRAAEVKAEVEAARREALVGPRPAESSPDPRRSKTRAADVDHGIA